ncbi:GGDEF domain-containing protein [Engelhardtia mirabilis]|uniref:diguanylate cyclase n=1 Tax=Engelhardtia mirabilis TaxID=2528011 RepID=A0A518BQG9_9BACT|nr:Diguanylate cyclase DosC [Planctomycetes bacterium Pla133]QDV03539.1 Diguanylate cyclase DosC [Planctomycetes bacterium Pla86]
MADPADLPFAQSKGLFSPDEMRRLMRSELARAKRYGFPLTCLVVGIDRLEALHDLYGVDSKSAIYRSVLEFLRRESRAADMVASLTGDRLILIVPYVDRVGGLRLAERMREGARKLDFASDSRALQVTLSVGVAHARTREPEAYDSLFRAADDCQRLAATGGGDRVVDVDVLDAARDRPAGDRRAGDSPERIEHERRQRADGPPADPNAVQVPTPSNPLAGLDPADLMEVVRDALGQLGLDAAALAQAQAAAQTAAPQPSPAAAATPAAKTAPGEDRSEELDLQDRRISKLAKAVQAMQEQLASLARGAGGDAGVASMGKVFGALEAAAGGGEGDDRRKELMGALFKANMALQKRRAAADDGA